MGFHFLSEQYELQTNTMWFILSWPRRGFHYSETARMPTRSMVHETASFYWHGIQSAPLGYMSLALQWATYNSAPCTCPHLTTPFNAFPPQPHFHSCINIISPVKKTRTTCSLPLLFLMVYAEQPTLSPLNSSPCLWIQPELARCQQILPQRSCLHCLTLQHAHLPIHHPSFISWTTITLN